METIFLKVKNATKLAGLILSLCSINSVIFGQTEKDQIHSQFLNLFEKGERMPVMSEIILDIDWLEYLNDSINIENGLKGGCQIRDLQKVLVNFNFDSLVQISDEPHEFNLWEKKKLPNVRLIKRAPKNGTYFQYSVPIKSNNWGLIRKRYFVKSDLLEDSILIFKMDNEREWKKMCELILYLELPHL